MSDEPQGSIPPPSRSSLWQAYTPPESVGSQAPNAPHDGSSPLGAYYTVQSIGIGILGMALPVVTALFLSGTVYFFVLLPIFGLIRGIMAMTRGSVVAGIVGIVLNVLAGLISFTAAGIINPG
jgi:hypothetical protein